MPTTINVNGTPEVFNNVLVSVDGDTEFPINEYLMGITYSTGSQADHVKTITKTGNPVATNVIVSSPTATLSFAPMMEEAFYTFLNNKFSTFTMQLIQYVTGRLDGSRKTLLIENARINEVSGGMKPSSSSNDGSFSIVATYIGYI
jgi:hypothetical protein